MADGWIKVHRSITDWEWFKDPKTRLVFEYLLYTANHAPARWRGIEIAPGQTVTSVKKLAEANGISEQNVKTAIKNLKSTGEITSKSTNKYTVITIEKWAPYQLDEGELTSKLTSKLTNNQQTTNKQLTTNKKEKKEKNKKNIEREIRESLSSLKENHEAFKAIKATLMAGGR